MSGPVEYTRGEKVALIALGAVGIIALNTVFAYALLFNPELVIQAHTNPVSAVFIAEAVLLMIFWAYFLRKWGVARLGWGWFVVLSLVGSMAFAIPVVLLWPKKKQEQPPSPGEPPGFREPAAG
jgi:hypothetical protein